MWFINSLYVDMCVCFCAGANCLCVFVWMGVFVHLCHVCAARPRAHTDARSCRFESVYWLGCFFTRRVEKVPIS